MTNSYDKGVYQNVDQLKQLLVDLGPMTVGVKAGGNYFYYPNSQG